MRLYFINKVSKYYFTVWQNYVPCRPQKNGRHGTLGIVLLGIVLNGIVYSLMSKKFLVRGAKSGFALKSGSTLLLRVKKVTLLFFRSERGYQSG